MVIDTSAIVSILFAEPGAEALARRIEEAPVRLVSAATLLEAAIVVEARKGEAGARELDLFIYRAEVEVVPVDHEQAEVARLGWRKFGKGRHPAALNFGDCFAYALALTTGSELLFTGADFGLTDVASA